MAFHVFVEGATDDTPAGVTRLADAIAKHYGLPAADLLVRLKRGRFRVKGNIDRTLAEQYRRDLERLGARCTIEEATAENSQRVTPLPFPAVRPATPPAGVPVTPSRPSTPPSGLAAARPSTPPSGLAAAAPSRPSTPPSGLAAAAPSRPSTPPSGLAAAATPASAAPQYQSGLAAAFSGEQPSASLGALEKDDLPLSLASVDGADEQAPPSTASFEPLAGAMPASIGPPPENATSARKPERPKDVPLDLFAPPDAQGEELAVDIAADELDITAKKRANTPPPVVDEPASTPPPEPVARRSQPLLQSPDVAPGAAVAAPSKLGPLGDVRVRFAAGVLLAILIGFVPAHLVASMREGSAYKAIDDKVIAVQQLADTPDLYATLDTMRADQLDKKRGEQRNTAIIALAIWALVGGGIAFGWFKKVPWDRFE